MAITLGIVGCGKISPIYFQAPRRCPSLSIGACCDLSREAAEARSAEFGVPKVVTLEEMLADPGIDLIVNLTRPGDHFEVALAAVRARKAVYNEKPLALTRQEGRALRSEAKRRKVRLGCAPDTFLGAGLQTCRKLIDAGAIGDPVSAVAFLQGPGHESWHPNPDFYYQPGGGPMFDMGPYYLTALVHLLGPVRRVTSSTSVTRPERVIGNGPRSGETIPVETPTHVAGVMDFHSGVVGTIITSFDVWNHSLPRIEIYGTRGTLSVPDPNTFGGPVRIREGREKEWTEVPLAFPNADNSRGLGVADMAGAMRSGRPHRASGELAFHVLDIMAAFLESSDKGRHVNTKSTCERPAPLPEGLAEGLVEEDAP